MTNGSYSTEDFARAFTEWDRRFREEPDRFQSEAARILKDTPETYGDAAAPYFRAILDEMSGAPTPAPAAPKAEV
jgi:hypothetical protein